jgi:hypothetical protein
VTLDFATLAGTVGPTAAVLIFMWLNRAPTAREKADDPMAKLAEKLNSIENRVIDVHADLQILKDRRPK